ncbi:MAG: hypothetical protein OEY40_04230 [Candidatus Bathyarchaeota archaeon]|nr:hypothetical protein [Candidatus Bathyarchaeota archaeon]
MSKKNKEELKRMTTFFSSKDVVSLHVSKDLYPKIEAKAEEWELTIQETIIRILREKLEQGKKAKK